MTVSKNRSEISNSQSATRTMNFHCENHRSRRLIGRTIFFTSKVKKLKWLRGLWTPVLLKTLFRNKKTRARQKKTQRDVKLLLLFSVNKSEERNIKDIPIEELNEMCLTS